METFFIRTIPSHRKEGTPRRKIAGVEDRNKGQYATVTYPSPPLGPRAPIYVLYDLLGCHHMPASQRALLECPIAVVKVALTKIGDDSWILSPSQFLPHSHFDRYYSNTEWTLMPNPTSKNFVF